MLWKFLKQGIVVLINRDARIKIFFLPIEEEKEKRNELIKE